MRRIVPVRKKKQYMHINKRYGRVSHGWGISYIARQYNVG